jgi:hypothetical protein
VIRPRAKPATMIAKIENIKNVIPVIGITPPKSSIIRDLL